MHTPGPWLLGTLTDDSAPFVYALNHKNYNHFWLSVQSNKDSFSASDEELMDNARLIAAAPDLLEALELMTHWARTWHYGPEREQAIHAAIKVIKKVKGEDAEHADSSDTA